MDILIAKSPVPPNLAAGLCGVRFCEGTGAPEGYRALYGWRPGRDDRLFSSYADHPNMRYWIGSAQPVEQGALFDADQTTTAAGAYQITHPTWLDFIKYAGPRSFSPQSQDECALWLIDTVHATDDLLNGNLLDAVDKMARKWASLPASTAGQHTMSYAQFCDVYLQAGGTVG